MKNLRSILLLVSLGFALEVSAQGIPQPSVPSPSGGSSESSAFQGYSQNHQESVNMSSLDLQIQTSDLAIPGRKLSFVIQKNYSSASSEQLASFNLDDILGEGWYLTINGMEHVYCSDYHDGYFHSVLLRQASGNVTKYTSENVTTAKVTYRRNDLESKSETLRYRTLLDTTKNFMEYDRIGGLFRYRTPGGVNYEFGNVYGPVFKLSSVVDIFGNEIKVIHNSTGKIERILDTLERNYVFEYTAPGYLTSILVWQAGGTSYEHTRYVYSGDHLVEYSDAEDRTTRYIYAPGSSRITKIIYPTGGYCEYEYGAMQQAVVAHITTSQGTILTTDWDDTIQKNWIRESEVTREVQDTDRMAVTKRTRTRMEDGVQERTLYVKHMTNDYFAEYAMQGSGTWGEVDSKESLVGGGSLTRRKLWEEMRLRENRTEIVDQAGSVTSYWYDSSGSLIRVRNPVYYDDAGNEYYEEIVNNYVESKSIETVTFRTDLTRERWYQKCGDSPKEMLNYPDRVEADCIWCDLVHCKKITKETNIIERTTVKTRENIVCYMEPVSVTNKIVINGVPDVVSGVFQKHDANGNVCFESNLVTGHVRYIQTGFDASGGFVKNLVTAAWETNLTRGVKVEIRDEYEFDDLGDILRIRKKLGDGMETLSTYEYDPAHKGNLARMEDGLGNVTRYEYSAETRYGYPSAIVKTLNGHEVRNVFGYDFYTGNVLWIEDYLGNRSEFRYDKAKRLIYVKNPDGGTREFDYNSGLQRSEIRYKDASGKLLQRQYRYFGDLGNPITEIVEDGQDPSINNKVQYVYDGRGLVTDIINDPEGARITTRQVYDGPGRLREIRYPDGGKKTFSFYYLPSQRLRVDEETIWPTDNAADRRTTRKVFDYEGRLLRIEYPEVMVNGATASLKTEYEYDSMGSLLLTRDAAGAEQKLYYDSFGRVVRTVFADGSESGNEYDLMGNLTAKIDVNGNRTEMEYNEQYKVVRVRDALGHETRTEYDANGNRTAEIDALGRRVESRYDAKNRLTSVIDPARNQTRYTYDSLDNRIEVVDKLGNTARSYYDGLSRLVRSVGPSGETTRVQYDNLNRKVWVSDAKGAKIFFFYDSMGRIVRSEDQRGNVSLIVYDYLGNKLRMTDPEGRWTESVYDKLNRLVRVKNAIGEQTFGYDAMGNKVKAVDAEGRMTRWTYDSQNRITSIVDAQGSVTRYGYDLLDNVKYMVDKADNFTQYEYDALGRKIGETKPDGKTLRFEYDAAGALIRSVDEAGIAHEARYDNLGQATNLNNGGDVVRYRYDAEGNLILTADSTGREEYIYDASGRVVDRKISYSGLATNSSLKSGYHIRQWYDLNGNMTNLGLPSGAKVRYIYDNLNRLEKVYSFGSKIAEYAYNRSGQARNAYYGNGTECRYYYDDPGRLSGFEVLGKRKEGTATVDGMLFAEYYTYDKANNRIEKRNMANEYSHYRYDAEDRLTGVEYKYEGAPQWDEEYSYDAMGNRTKMKYKFGAIDYDYDMRTSRLKEYRVNQNGISRYEYDSRGNTVLKRDLSGDEPTSEFHYEFDAANRLKRILHNNLKINNGEQTEIEYWYNSAGMRVGVKEPTSGTNKGSLSYYIYSGNEVVAELDNEARIRTEFVFGLEKTVRAEYLEPIKPDTYNSTLKVKLTWFHSDSVGSAQLLTDDQGYLIQEYQYNPFGSLIYARGADGNKYLFAGKNYDESTGLSFFGARYYDPLTGRFISEDPVISVFNPTTHNPYVYAANNPYKYVDPDGRLFGIVPSISIGWGKHGLILNVGVSLQLGPFYVGIGINIAGNGKITPSVNAGFGMTGIGIGLSWSLGGDLGTTGDDTIGINLGYTREKSESKWNVGVNASYSRQGLEVGASVGYYGVNIGGGAVFDRKGLAGFTANLGLGFDPKKDPVKNGESGLNASLSYIRKEFDWSVAVNAQTSLAFKINDPEFRNKLEQLIKDAPVPQEIKDKINIDDIMAQKYDSVSWKLLNDAIRESLNLSTRNLTRNKVANNSDWEFYDLIKSIEHQDPNIPGFELKYGNKYTGQEVVFTQSGAVLTSGEYRGTLNFSTPKQFKGIIGQFKYIIYHEIFDVQPFYELGIGKYGQ